MQRINDSGVLSSELDIYNTSLLPKKKQLSEHCEQEDGKTWFSLAVQTQVHIVISEFHFTLDIYHDWDRHTSCLLNLSKNCEINFIRTIVCWGDIDTPSMTLLSTFSYSPYLD